MNTTHIGRSAEQLVARRLLAHGFTIVAHNWRTRRCEIDVIARRRGVIYFVEVKYRTSTQQGSGFDYITRHKLRQLQYAAHTWIARHGSSSQYEIVIASVNAQGKITFRRIA